MSTAVEEKIVLTEEQKAFYEENGFLIVRDVLSPEDVALYRARAREIALGDYPKDIEKRRIVRDVKVAKGEFVPKDPEDGIWKLLNPDRFDKVFHDYAYHPRVLDVLEGLIGPDIKSFLTMFIYKPPFLDNATHHYHQDGLYFNFGPHDLVCGTWAPLDPVDKDNGTLLMIPGSHKGKLLPHVLPKQEHLNRGIFGVEGYDDHPNQVECKMNPGDCAFFHARTLHKTPPNVTDRKRRVVTVHFCSSKCKPQGAITSEFEFRLVRGQSYEGCV